jgi:16S rRNA C967 or C1407 C5-methylase (RsmB/RsmF family)
LADTRKRNRFVERTAQAMNLSRAEVEDLFQGARATTARVNRLHPGAGVEQIEAELRELVPSLVPVPWCPLTWRSADRSSLSAAVPLIEDGRVYLQNASSLIPVHALDPRPGEWILDVAAAPGGKAFHIAARTGNEGELWLNDGSSPRAQQMADLAAVYGVRVTELTSHPAQYLDKHLAGHSFDRILLDVQCSGEGRVDLRHRDALRFWSEARIERYTFLQTKMLDAAYRLLRPGGVMVYSTCTVAPEENELPVSRVLSRHEDLDLVPFEVPEPNLRPGRVSWRDTRFDRRLTAAVRVVPDGTFEAFFAAKLVRRR